LEDGNLYLRLRTMSHTIYAAKFEQTITHQHVFLRRESQSHVLLRRESQSYCWSIRNNNIVFACLIARRILLILDMLIIFSEYICLKR